MDCLLTLSWEGLLWEKVLSQIQFLNKDCSVSCWQRQMGRDRDLWVCKPHKPHSTQACVASSCYFLTQNLNFRKKPWQSFFFLPQFFFFSRSGCIQRHDVNNVCSESWKWKSISNCGVLGAYVLFAGPHTHRWGGGALREGPPAWELGDDVVWPFCDFFLHVSWAPLTHDWVLRWSLPILSEHLCRPAFTNGQMEPQRKWGKWTC